MACRIGMIRSSVENCPGCYPALEESVTVFRSCALGFGHSMGMTLEDLGLLMRGGLMIGKVSHRLKFWSFVLYVSGIISSLGYITTTNVTFSGLHSLYGAHVSERCAFLYAPSPEKLSP